MAMTNKEHTAVNYKNVALNEKVSVLSDEEIERVVGGGEANPNIGTDEIIFQSINKTKKQEGNDEILLNQLSWSPKSGN